MHEGNIKHAMSQTDVFNWGSMRMDFAHEEFMRKNHSNPIENPLTILFFFGGGGALRLNANNCPS